MKLDLKLAVELYLSHRNMDRFRRQPPSKLHQNQRKESMGASASKTSKRPPVTKGLQHVQLSLTSEKDAGVQKDVDGKTAVKEDHQEHGDTVNNQTNIKTISDNAVNSNTGSSEGQEGDMSKTKEEKEISKPFEYTFMEKRLEQLKGKPFLTENKKSLTEELRNVLSAFEMAYLALKKASAYTQSRYRRELVNEVVNSGVLAGICQVLLDGDDLVKRNQTCIGNILTMTDTSPGACEVVCSHPGFLEFLASRLTVSSSLHISSNPKGKCEDIDALIGIIHNCLTTEIEAIQHRIRELDFTKIIIPYIDSPNVNVRLLALAALAGIVDENESAILKANPNLIKDLMITLKRAMNTRHLCEWSPTELARIVRQIARNDTNKRLVVEHGCLPSLVTLAKKNELVEETQEAVKALWVLAFDDENRKQMLENKDLGVVEVLTQLQSSPDKTVRNTCRGALWTLEEKTKRKEESVTEDPGTKTQDVTGHVMISYQWDHQSTLTEINSKLKSCGYMVWIDVDQMGGSTLQAMAEAVENAMVVLICISQKYKDSPNCRAEAEYAFEKRKLIVPLVMEKGYRPDGWLGMIVGTKLRFDFSGKYPFEAKLQGLKAELQRLQNRDEVDTIRPTTVATTHTTQSEDYNRNNQFFTYKKNIASNWTSDQIMEWLDSYHLSRERFGSLSGEEIEFLRNMYYRAPETYYKTLKRTLRVKDLLTMAVFTKALEEL